MLYNVQQCLLYVCLKTLCILLHVKFSIHISIANGQGCIYKLLYNQYLHIYNMAATKPSRLEMPLLRTSQPQNKVLNKYAWKFSWHTVANVSRSMEVLHNSLSGTFHLCENYMALVFTVLLVTHVRHLYFPFN